MGLKSALLKLYNFPFLSKEKVDKNQQIIRDTEWNAIKPFIPAGSRFLDVGCGTGYSMMKAKELNCTCYGIDPDPGRHGVGRYKDDTSTDLIIVKGNAEKLPYTDNEFDVVYCSHVLEHVDDEQQSLKEIRRVLKPGGTLIIGMPTAQMAFIHLITELLFTSHMRFVNFFFSPFINTAETQFIHVFIPKSHSYPRANTVLYDLKHYQIKNWKKIVSSVMNVDQTIFPALYPYPEFLQLFKLRKSDRYTSSVFFICRK